MLNLRRYPEPCIDAYKNALSRKRVDGLQEKLEAIEPQIISSYDIFDDALLHNNLQELEADDFFDDFSEDLQSLYKYDSRAIRDIKKGIEGHQIHKIVTTCQNCTINSIDTFDHILAQTDFPQFAVNAHNLFPSCTDCNRRKSSQFMHEGNRRFLNLYLDNLPSEQYLFVEFSINRTLDFQYKIENRNGINNNLFQVIKNHYDFLDLAKRMKEKASEGYISELEALIKDFLGDFTLERIIEKCRRKAMQNLSVYGYNHFRFILELALMQNPDFLARF